MHRTLAVIAALLFLGTLAGVAMAEDEPAPSGDAPDETRDRRDRLERLDMRLAKMEERRDNLTDNASRDRLDAVMERLREKRAIIAECGDDRAECRDRLRDYRLGRAIDNLDTQLDRLERLRERGNGSLPHERLDRLEQRLERRQQALEDCREDPDACRTPDGDRDPLRKLVRNHLERRDRMREHMRDRSPSERPAH